MKTMYRINNNTAMTTTLPKAPADVVSSDAERQLQKPPYPRSIPFLIGCMFFERVAMNGMKTVLIIYLTSQLAFGTDEATMIYHSFHTLTFLTSIFGAIVSDSWLGKYNTIFVTLVTSIVGMTMMITGTVSLLHLPSVELTLLALVVLAVGNGCMKPCIVAFGGDQFEMPEQTPHMATFFSIVYFTMKVSAFVGSAITPILRNDMKCLGQDSCFPLAFGVPGMLMTMALAFFICGKCFYIVRPSKGNILVRVCDCIRYAIVSKVQCRKSEKISKNLTTPEMRAHWLDASEAKFGHELVHDTKVLLNLLVLYLPIPFYWALNEQTGSRWTLQASRMSGDIGFYEVKPDQMQIVMQVLLIVCIPLFQTVIYPLMAKIGFHRPLQKLALAMVLAASAFVVAGCVELKLHPNYAVLPKTNECQFRVYNTLPCRVVYHTGIPGNEQFSISPLDAYQSTVVMVDTPSSVYSYTLQVEPNCPVVLRGEGQFQLTAGLAVSYYFNGQNISAFEDSPQKALSQRPVLRVLVVALDATLHADVPLAMFDQDNGYLRYKRRSTDQTSFTPAPSRFELRIDGNLVTSDLQLRRGRVSTLLVTLNRNGSRYDFNEVELTPPNTVHMFWMLPQYALLAMGEAILGVTGMVFAYSEAPDSMKTVLQAFWLLNISMGNLIDVIVVGLDLIQSQANEFFLFAGIMFINIGLFTWLSKRYKPFPKRPDSDVVTKPLQPMIENLT